MRLIIDTPIDKSRDFTALWGKDEIVKIEYKKWKGEMDMTKKMLSILYLIFWVSAVIVFYFFLDPSDAMGYSVAYIWILIPAITLLVSISVGKNNYWGRGKWFLAFILGMLYMLLPYVTFDMSYMLSIKKAQLPDFLMILYGVVISFVGLGIGTGIRYYKIKKKIIL